MPAQSITTLVIPLRSENVGMDDLLVDGCEYLIIPRQETNRAVTSTSSKVTLEDVDYGEAQRWRLAHEGNGTYSFTNGLGLRLTAHRASNSSSLTAVKNTANEQDFYIDEVDYPYFKILASRGRSHGLDLTNASSNTGTTVGIWQYNEGNTKPTHRQWMLFPLTSPQLINGIEQHVADSPIPTSQGIYDLSGRRIDNNSTLSKGIYIVNGKKVVVAN